MIPTANVHQHHHHRHFHKPHHHKHQSPAATRKTHHEESRPSLHLPNEGMDNGDNVNVAESSGNNDGKADDISLKAIENDEHFGNQLDVFQDGIKESSMRQKTEDLPKINSTKNTSSDILYTINKTNQSVSDGLKAKQSDEESYKILVKDYELSGGDDSDEDEDITFKKPPDSLNKKLTEKNLTHPSSDSQFFTNTSASMGKTNINVTSQDDFEVVNSNESSQQKQNDTQTIDVSRKQRPDDWEPVSRHQGDNHEIGFKNQESKSDSGRQPNPDLHSGYKSNTLDPNARHLGDNNGKTIEPIASTRYLGDKNDWGNGTPTVSSEDKHYWDKEKKTKANINNVNHKLKDFSSNFFTSTMRHDKDEQSEDNDVDEKVERKNTTISEHNTEDVSSKKKNSTISLEDQPKLNSSNNSMLYLNRKDDSMTIEKVIPVQDSRSNKTSDLEDNKKLKNVDKASTNKVSKNNTFSQSDSFSNETFGDSGVTRDPPITNSSRNAESVDHEKLSLTSSINKDIPGGHVESKSHQNQDQIQLVVESEPGVVNNTQQNVKNESHSSLQNTNRASGLQIAKINITKIKEMGKLQNSVKTNETLTKNSASTLSNDTLQDFTKRLKSRLQLMSEKRQFSNRTLKMVDETSRVIVVTPSKSHENAHTREIDGKLF